MDEMTAQYTHDCGEVPFIPFFNNNVHAEYWRKRSEAVEAQLHQKSEEYYREAEKQFKKAEKQIADDIEKWYARLADNNDIGLAEARKFLDADELEEFKWTVEEYIKHGKENGVSKDWTKELENGKYRKNIYVI